MKPAAKVLSIPTNIEKYFKVFTTLVYKPIYNMTDTEVLIFSEILKLNWDKRSIDEEDRFKLIFSVDSKREIREKLNVGQATFNNYMKKLRDKGLVQYGGINKSLLIDPDIHKSIVINFKL